MFPELSAIIHLLLYVRLRNLKQVVGQPSLVLHEIVGVSFEANAIGWADLLPAEECHDRKARSRSKESKQKGLAVMHKAAFFELRHGFPVRTAAGLRFERIEPVEYLVVFNDHQNILHSKSALRAMSDSDSGVTADSCSGGTTDTLRTDS